MFILLFTFCQCLVIAGLLLAVVFSFAVFVLLRKTSFFMDSQNYYCLFMDSEKSAICSPFALCARLWCWWYVCLSNGLTRYSVAVVRLVVAALNYLNNVRCGNSRNGALLRVGGVSRSPVGGAWFALPANGGY